MKKTILLLVILYFLPTNSLATPVTVFLRTSDLVVMVGDSFTVDIVADIPEPVLGWGLDIGFEDAIFSFTNVSIGPSWSPVFSADGDGLAGLTFSPLYGGDILLATLSFEAISLGTSVLCPSVTPGDLSEGFPLALAPPGSFADVVFESKSVTAVPEPSTVLLLGFGIACLCFMGHSSWRQKTCQWGERCA